MTDDAKPAAPQWLFERRDPAHPSDEWWVEPYDGDTGYERDALYHGDDPDLTGEGWRV